MIGYASNNRQSNSLAIPVPTPVPITPPSPPAVVPAPIPKRLQTLLIKYANITYTFSSSMANATIIPILAADGTTLGMYSRTVTDPALWTITPSFTINLKSPYPGISAAIGLSVNGITVKGPLTVLIPGTNTLAIDPVSFKIGLNIYVNLKDLPAGTTIEISGTATLTTK